VRVLALVSLPTSGAGNRLRVEQYVPLLRGRGIEMVVSPFFDEHAYRILYRPGHTLAKAIGTLRGIARRIRDVLRAGRFDLVLVYRESAPLGPPLIERLLRRIGVPYVYDFDDALFLAPIHPVNRRWTWLRDPSRYAETARGAVAVTTVNDYLAEWAREYNVDVSVIPTPVDTSVYRPQTVERSGPLVIGWSGSSTTAPYLKLLDEALAVLAERIDLVVRVIGGSYAHPRAVVQLIPWRLETEPSKIAGFDIGVLPEPDDSWTRGKGAFKALLYMASGVPVVASAIGVNPEVVADGMVGYCVSDTAGWIRAIETLAVDRVLRARLGSAGRLRVEERYSLDVQVPRLAEVLTRAARR